MAKVSKAAVEVMCYQYFCQNERENCQNAHVLIKWLRHFTIHVIKIIQENHCIVNNSNRYIRLEDSYCSTLITVLLFVIFYILGQEKANMERRIQCP